ncbi:pyridoxamine 5'-phosphate oxidase family protein [Thalassiella azotivora]
MSQHPAGDPGDDPGDDLGVGGVEQAGTVPRLVDASCLAELAWVGPDGPRALAVTPLRLGDDVAVALPYAWADGVRAAAAAGRVVLSLTDPRMTSSGWSPAALHGSARLVEDVDGSVFTDQLLDQELRKHPPSRVLADSALLRRENWWFLPRAVLVVAVDGVRPLPARHDPAVDAVLVTGTERAPEVDVVRLLAPDADALPVRRVADDTPPTGAGPVGLLTHTCSVPDLERWVQRLTSGTLHDGVVVPDDGPPGRLQLPGPPGLLQRWRRQQQLERACRRGIAAAEAGRPS